VRSISLKSRFNACFECEVTVLSKLNSKKRVCISIDIQKKNVHHLDSDPRPPECKSVALPIEPYGCGFQWNVAQVFSTSSSCQAAVERKLIPAFTRGDKLEGGR